jgi:class 3 adenylate cyclase
MSTTPRPPDNQTTDPDAPVPKVDLPPTATFPDAPTTQTPPPHTVPRTPTGPPVLPSQFGRYQILCKLGAGGMGTVYLARDAQLGRLVALKVPHLGPQDGAEYLGRFYREAQAAAALRHPNLCPVYDVGEISGIHYLTMAYIEGQTLADLAAGYASQSPRHAVALVRTLALALEDAHAQGIVHRDLKPANIMMTRRHEPVIMDFGLARHIRLEDVRLTQHGTRMGTPAYMPPEQLAGHADAVGPTGDVYSLGVILYELLTGELPFQGSITAIDVQKLCDEPPSPARIRPDIDGRLEAICLRAMARRLEDRFPSMRAFADALDAYLRGDPPAPPSAPAVSFFDPQLAGEVLTVLRTWGCGGTGLRRLREQAADGGDEQRHAYQSYADWMSGKPGLHEEALQQLATSAELPALTGWALTAQAVAATRERDYRRAHDLLDRAARAGADDLSMWATIAHNRGVVLAHQDRFDQALPQLHEALAHFGPEQFGTGRVLDTLGMAYAGKGNFQIAREFYEQAIRAKERFDDAPGLALSYGQLGRLYLAWGHLDQAEECFQADLRLAQRIVDERGEAQMYNHLGQVALARGEREWAAGHHVAARRLWAESAGWLDVSIRKSVAGGWAVPEGYARKDRALLSLVGGDVTQADEQARQAEKLFQGQRFAEGLAQINRAWGMIRRAQGRWEDATRKLRAALVYFENAPDHAEAARTLWEIARTQRTAGYQPPLLTRAFEDALERAEACRRDELVAAIEEELREVDPEAYLRHLYRRVRGRGLREDTPTLAPGTQEVLTILFLELHGLDEYGRDLNPESVLMTLNQMMADLGTVLERQRARVTAYFGDGLLALFREGRHGERAVDAALELLAALGEFNRPRAVLGLTLIQARVGIHTGPALLGNVGTYQKMDFTAVGAAVTLASRLLSWAEPGVPCISRETRQLVADRFTYRPGCPRTVTPAGLAPVEVWDVAGKATE